MAANADEIPQITFGGQAPLPEVTFGEPVAPISPNQISFNGESVQDELDKDQANFITALKAAGALPGGFDDLNVKPPMTISDQEKRQALKDSTEFFTQNATLFNLGAAKIPGMGGLLADEESALKRTSAVTEEVTRIPSALLDQTGEIVGQLFDVDREDNTLVNLANVMRESTKSPEFEEEGFSDELFRGIVQTGGFALGGKGLANALKVGNKAAGAIAAWMGAAVGGQAGKEDAIRNGATEGQTDVAYWLNQAFGATEGISIGLALSRIDDLSGGLIGRKIKSDTAKTISGGVRSAVEEGLQEAFQTFGENITAKEWAAYDPSRPLSENILNAAGVGGSVGLLMGLVTTALGVRKRGDFERDVNKLLEFTGANSLEEIGGDFTTLQEGYFDILKEEGRILQTLEEAAIANPDVELAALESITMAESRGRVGVQAPAGTEPKLSRVGVTPSTKRHVEHRVLSKHVLMPINVELEGDTTAVQRIKRTPVTLAFTVKKTEADKLIPEMNKELQRLMNIDTPEALREFESIQEKKAQLEHLVKVEKAAAKDAKSLIASLMPLMPKGAKLFLQNHDIGKKKSVSGQAYRWRIDDETTTGVISLRFDDLFTAESMLAIDPENSVLKQMRDDARIGMLSTLVHEFGHNHAYETFAEMGDKIRFGTASAEDMTIFKAIQQDYFKFIAEGMTADSGVALSRMFSHPRFNKWMEAWNVFERGSTPSERHDAFSSRTRMRSPVSTQFALPTIDYIFSFDEFLAEEFAKHELNFGQRNPESTPFFEKGIKDMKKALATTKKRHRGLSPSMNNYFKLHSIRGKIRSAQENMEKSKLEPDPFMAIIKDGDVKDLEMLRRAMGDVDKFNKFMDVGFNILQIAKENPHIRGLQSYVRTIQAWKNEVNNTLALAEDRLTEWKNLGSKENEQLGRLLLDETMGHLPNGKWLKEPREFTDKEIATYNLSPEALQLRDAVKKDFAASLTRMEEVLIAAKRKIFADNPLVQTQEVAKVQKEFAQLRKRPYFPLMRFGEYTMQIRAKGEQTVDGRNYKDEDIIDFQAFDTKPERDRALRAAKRNMGNTRFGFSGSKMLQPNFSVQGMPLTLVDHLENRLQTTELTDEQRKIFQEVKKDVLPFRSFRKQFQRRKKVGGFSLDAQRSYANYMSSFANHIARVEFDSVFKGDLDSVKDSISAINRKDGGDSTRRAGILNHMNEHLQYVMNPVDEYVALRSAAFFWFLGFNVKSAFVNLTQIPLVTYPYLAARFGDGKAVAQLTRANGTAIKLLTKPETVKDENLKQMIEQGLKESWLDESLATELALAASEKNLDKSLPRNARQRLVQNISRWGSLPFHTAEKFNRHVTAVATYRLAIAAKKSHTEAVEESRRAVDTTQFEYARYARPKFMRGKVGGTVFVFQNYMQNALYFALGGDPGAFRMIVMLFMLAGLQGLPFGENIADLVDAAMTALKRRTGVKDPQTAVRVDLRKMLKDINVDPDLVLHGLSSSTFGLANIGEFMGWPIPDSDLSGSLSMGRIIPGTELLQPGREATFERFTADAAERVGGAILSGASGIARAFFDSHPDQWKRWERAMPAAMRQISKAQRFKVRGEEATRAGYPIAGFDMTDTRDQGEIIAQSLGFTPREVAKGWEGFIAEQQAITYYETWKSSLLRQWNYAHENQDQEEIKRTNGEIRKYNAAVPFPEMKVGSEVRMRSYESYLRTRQFNSRRIEQSRAARRMSSSIQQVFEEPDN